MYTNESKKFGQIILEVYHPMALLSGLIVYAFLHCMALTSSLWHIKQLCSWVKMVTTKHCPGSNFVKHIKLVSWPHYTSQIHAIPWDTPLNCLLVYSHSPYALCSQQDPVSSIQGPLQLPRGRCHADERCCIKKKSQKRRWTSGRAFKGLGWSSTPGRLKINGITTTMIHCATMDLEWQGVNLIPCKDFIHKNIWYLNYSKHMLLYILNNCWNKFFLVLLILLSIIMYV